MIKKHNHNLAAFFAISFLIILLFFLINYYNARDNYALQKYLGKFGVTWEIAEEFVLNKSINQITKDNAKLIAKSGNNIMRLEIFNKIDNEVAEKQITNKKYVVDSLFLNIAAPYPGAITTTLECPEQFKPKIKETTMGDFETSYYEIFATERLTYGACSEDLIKYKAILAWVYCEKSKNLFQIELFVPKEEFKEEHINLIKSFRCGK